MIAETIPTFGLTKKIKPSPSWGESYSYAVPPRLSRLTNRPISKADNGASVSLTEDEPILLGVTLAGGFHRLQYKGDFQSEISRPYYMQIRLLVPVTAFETLCRYAEFYTVARKSKTWLYYIGI